MSTSELLSIKGFSDSVQPCSTLNQHNPSKVWNGHEIVIISKTDDLGDLALKSPVSTTKTPTQERVTMGLESADTSTLLKLKGTVYFDALFKNLSNPNSWEARLIYELEKLCTGPSDIERSLLKHHREQFTHLYWEIVTLVSTSFSDEFIEFLALCEETVTQGCVKNEKVKDLFYPLIDLQEIDFSILEENFKTMHIFFQELLATDNLLEMITHQEFEFRKYILQINIILQAQERSPSMYQIYSESEHLSPLIVTYHQVMQKLDSIEPKIILPCQQGWKRLYQMVTKEVTTEIQDEYE